MKLKILLFVLFAFAHRLTFAKVGFLSENLYVDVSITKNKFSVGTTQSTFHIYSHGKPGELLINGKWLNKNEIAHFLKPLLSSVIQSINIYGCEFGKGSKGELAVAYLEKELAVSVAASNNITGKNGDWKLEVGKTCNGLPLLDFGGSLQCSGVKGGAAAADDYDEDGLCNNIDLDDDNDGIADKLEMACTKATTLINATDLVTVSGGSFFGGTAGNLINAKTVEPTNDNFESYAKIISSTSSSPITFTFKVPVTLNSIKVFNAWGYMDSQPSKWFFRLKDATGKLLFTTATYTNTNYTSTCGSGSCEPMDPNRVKLQVNTHGAANTAKVKIVEWVIENYSQTRVYSPNSNTLTSPNSTVGFAETREIMFYTDESCKDADTDGDVISDHLDLDADGDSCPDAIEGGAAITYQNLTKSAIPGGNSGPTFNGTWKHPVITNLSKSSVDGTGIPNIAAGGQTVGTSQNKNSQDILCPTAIPLPIGMRDFKAEWLANKGAQLTWHGAGIETDGSRYEIQRSVDGINFGSIGIVNAVAGKEGAYQFMDKETDLNHKPIYYRIQLQDADSREFKYSNIVNVNIASNSRVQFYPNPAKTNIRFSNLHGVVSIEIRSLTGQLVQQITKQAGLKQDYNIAHLPDGMYMISFIMEESAPQNMKLLVRK